jgi:hypothetical protein
MGMTQQEVELRTDISEENKQAMVNLTDDQRELAVTNLTMFQPFDHVILTKHLENLRNGGEIQGYAITELLTPQCNGIAKIYELVDGNLQQNTYLFNYNRETKQYNQLLMA